MVPSVLAPGGCPRPSGTRRPTPVILPVQRSGKTIRLPRNHRNTSTPIAHGCRYSERLLTSVSITRLGTGCNQSRKPTVCRPCRCVLFPLRVIAVTWCRGVVVFGLVFPRLAYCGDLLGCKQRPVILRRFISRLAHSLRHQEQAITWRLPH